MKVVRGLLIAVALLAFLFAFGLGIAWVRTAPVALPEGSESQARLAAVAKKQKDPLEPRKGSENAKRQL